MMFKINGKTISVIGNNNKINGITIKNNNLIINGTAINLKDYEQDYVVNIEVTGDIYGDIKTNGDVTISGSCKNIDTNGSVEVGGNIEGDIDTNGNVNCYGDIKGDIDTNGNVSLRRK